MAAMAIPMMQAQTARTKAESMRDMTTRNVVIKSNPMQATQWGVRPTATPKLRAGEINYLWDFETDESFEGWGAYDADGDGYNWGVDDTGENSLSGVTCLVSDSYLSGGVGALDPQNWLISPDVPLDGILTIHAMNYSSYFADKFGVYVCVGEAQYLSDFVQIAGDFTPGTSYQEFTIDLSEYAGQMGCFAIVHQNSYNMYHLFIDDISLAIPVRVNAPEDLTAVPTDVTADVTWTDTENAAWNLRYREYVDTSENLLWDFETDTEDNTNIDLTDGWTCIDADGDGNEWYHLYGSNFVNHTGNGHVTSASYMGGALTPDNWLVSPMVKLDGTLSFWAAGQDADYAAEEFAVYVSTGDPTDPASFELISDQYIVANAEMTQYTFDLSRYGGEDGYVAIRHYHVSDMFRLNVDDIEIIYTEPAEWIYVDNLDATNYTIDGLTPETTYEVQVQAINNEGQMSNWTPSTIFTTLEAQIPQTAAPVVEHHSGVNGDHTMYVTVSESEPNCELEYRYKYNDEEWSDWMPYDGEFSFTEDGKYEIEARAKADNKEWSEVNVETGEGYDQFQITPRTAVNELNGQKAVAAVRYYNAIGQEMAQPSGMTIVVTTYSDGTTSAVKVMK